jgi:hypothetical protein
MVKNNTTATRIDLSGDAVEEISSNLRRLLAEEAEPIFADRLTL